MYKNNSRLIAKTKVSKYKKGLYLTEKVSECKSTTILILDSCHSLTEQTLNG